MENDTQTSERETPPQHWTSCKLIIDPALTKGLYKVYRYDGQYYNIPVEDLGLFPVGTVRDPRICRLWSKCTKTDLTVPKFKVDKWYIGPVPPKEVTFSRLNDNVREAFLSEMCKKFGNAEEVQIFYCPKNKKHLGLAKVVFDTVKAAKEAVQHLHQTSVMGNIIHVEIDPKGENRARYLQLLLHGLYTPWTLPVGSSEGALQSFIDSLLVSTTTQRPAILTSPSSIFTPLSLDTAYSSIWQDTPCSFGLTPRSQGTPLTPCLSATPLSQDSCYSSLQATPVLQGEPSTYNVHKPFRGELCHGKPARYHRGSGEVSDVNFILKHWQPQITHRNNQAQIQSSKRQLTPWGQDENSTSQENRCSSSDVVSPCEETTVVLNAASKSLQLKCKSLGILSIDFKADQKIEKNKNTCITDLFPSAELSSSSPQHEVESLDSRIESLLTNSQIVDPLFFGRKSPEAEEDSEDNPASLCSVSASPVCSSSLFCAQTPHGFSKTSNQHSCSDLVDVGSTWKDTEDDETAEAVSFLTRNAQSQGFTNSERRGHTYNEKEAEGTQTLSYPQEHHAEDEDYRLPRALSPTTEILLQPPPFSSPHCTPPRHPTLTVRPGSSLPSAPPFPPPPYPPPVPPRLPNGTIPIPPPGWILPPGQPKPIPIPPPPIIRPSGPPPPLMLSPSVPPPAPLFPLPTPPTGGLDKGPSGTLQPFPRPPWPAPPFPSFNPFVPPPGFPLVRDNPHKVTVEKVLEVILDELKSIIKKDITRRTIEGVAFKTFEDWWERQEKKIKIQDTELKSGAVRAGDRNSLINRLSCLRNQGKIPPLPSFKVKRRKADDPLSIEKKENVLCTSIENDEVKQREDPLGPAAERAKRRHARPHELDSDEDDEVQEEESTTQDKEMSLNNLKDRILQLDNDPQIMSSREDHDASAVRNQPEEYEKSSQNHGEVEDAVICQKRDEEQSSGNDIFSDSSSSEQSENLSDFDSSDPFTSESSEDSSYTDFGSYYEDIGEDREDGMVDDCIVISSDEECMALEPPVSLSAPQTPGAQLDLDLQDLSPPPHKDEMEQNWYRKCQQDAFDLDVLMELQTSEPLENLLPFSPIGCPATAEPPLDVEMESPEWTEELLENMENLRPPTPSGFLMDSDLDLSIQSKPTSPAVEKPERPQTPGRGIVSELESENSTDEATSFSPTNTELITPPSDLLPAYPSYQERPRTPGREDKGGWRLYSSIRAPATPGRETEVSECNTALIPSLTSPPPEPCLSNNTNITVPRTPGRDIILPRRSIVHRRKTQIMKFRPALCDPLRDSSPCSPSESSSDSADGGTVWTSPGVRIKTLQGLENMPQLLNEENWRGPEKSFLRRKHLRRLKRGTYERQRLKRKSSSLPFHGHPHRWRSLSKERILHLVWTEGLDEEDARLLQCMYERLQEQDNGFGWLNDTLWIPHPLTKVVTESSDKLNPWQPQHRTGSARSEGFYRISRKDKLKYLNSTKPNTELPSMNTQGVSIPVQPPTSLRAGSDFRSEQRRLLSSFSCDSDLVKFNQLKFRKKRIHFSRSHIHQWGLFAMEPIAADEMVIEYVGQIIRQVIADMREQRYEEEGIGSSYLFRVDQDTIIDATKCGNLARFINHSCNPNCYAKIITVDSQKKIVIYSRQPISVDEEITYDYKFPIEDTKIPCLCGAESCRGSLN